MVISKGKQIEYRRNQVAEMLIEARTQQEIANILGVSQQTISLDVAFLEKRAKEETKVLVEKKLPLAHLNALNGIDKVIRECWKVINETKSDQVKHQYLTLVSNSYRMRNDLLTDAKTVNDVLSYIDTNLKRIVDFDLQRKIEEKEKEQQQQQQ